MKNEYNLTSHLNETLFQAAYGGLAPELDNAADMAKVVVRTLCKFSSSSEQGTSLELFMVSKEPNENSTSYKPRNCVLNWRNFFISIPRIVMTAAGAATSPWLLPFAALLVCNEILVQSRIEVSYNHGITMLVMWINSDEQRTIPMLQAFEKTNGYLCEIVRKQLSYPEFQRIINDLIQLKAINIDDDRILLREYVICR